MLLLLLVPTSMQASNEAYENAKDRMYISCMPLSGSSYRFKVLVFSRASYNHWAGSGSYISYKIGNDAEVKLFEFQGKNYDGVKTGSVETAWVTPATGQGTFSVNEVLLKNGSKNECKTLPASIIESDQPSFFLQIDWTPDYETFEKKNVKSLSVLCHVYDECVGTDHWRDYNLGKYSYNNTIQQPRLIQPYIDINAPKSEQGRMVLTWTTMKECDSLSYTLDGKEIKKSGHFANSDTFSLPQTNSVRTVSIDTKMYQDENRTSPVFLSSNSVEVLPYQAMSSFSVTELGGSRENNYLNRGFNKLEWTIDYPSSTDYIPGDQFVLKRGYKSDLSDAETIETVSIFSTSDLVLEPVGDGKIEKDSPDGEEILVKDTIITKAIFTYIDSTVGAYCNRDAKDKTIVFPFSEEDVVFKDGTYRLAKYESRDPEVRAQVDSFFKHFVTYNRKVYYSVERASAASLFTNLSEKYQRKDSVAKTKQLPLINQLTVQKVKGWDQNHQAAITIQLYNFTPVEGSINLLDHVGQASNTNVGKKIVEIIDKYGMTDRMYEWDTNAKILLWRHTRELNDSVLVEVPSDNVRLTGKGSKFEVEVRDVQPDAFLHYYYTAYLDASQSYLPIAECLNKPVSNTPSDSLYYEGAAHIKSFEASMDHTDGIRLTWSRYDGSFSAYQLQRKEEGSDVFETLDVKSEELEKGFYLDTKAKRGKTYEYRLVLLFNHYGITFQDEKDVVGRRAPYAIVKGKLKTSNGVGVAGIRVAVISSSKNTCGAEVMKDTVETEADGSYTARVVACEDAVTIKVAPADGKLKFLTASNGQPDTELSSTLTSSDYSGVDFILQGGYQFIGRVLYKNSTIPVADATFKVNGKYLYNSAGKLVKTDAYGNFSFMVPPHQVSVRVEKEGHQFDNDGYIHKKNGSASDTLFTPDGDYVGLEIMDNTRIRMIGKIAGGTNQGSKPVGFGNLSGSENVLGDSITLVLQLEGDNTAQFVFLKSTPDITTIDTTYQHYADTVGKTVVGATKVSYQKKRIVVVADNKTGEFALDLFPARYKIIQMYANGYSTLFAPNEGAQVLDLTDPSLLESKTDTLTVKDKTYYTRYNAMYKRIYHCPVTLTYKQNIFGLDKPYLGDEQLASVGLMNDLHLVTAAKMNPDTKEVSYLFKYPVFNQDVNYTLKVFAREDYYYNNEKQNGLKDSVPVSYGTLNVNNGLTKNGKTLSLKMDSLGMASFSFKADNPTFTLLGEDALRTMDFSVEVADYYYDAEPLKAYVLGTRKKGSDAVVYTSENAGLGVLDVLRDPPGSKSYSFLGKGAKYTFSRSMEFDLKLGVNLSFSYGSNYTAVTGISAGAGPFTGLVQEGETSWSFDIPIPIVNWSRTRKGTYEYVVNEAIKTSGAEGETGSMYDVYIGTGVNVRVERVDAFSTIDHEQYKVSKPAIESGAIKVVAASADSVDGHPSAYIVINELLDYQEEYPTYFAYTQKYIIGTLLPKLVHDRNALLKDTTKKALEEIYKQTKKVQYRPTVPSDSAIYGMEGGYERICDKSNTEDEIANINNQIRFWINMICLNDSIKVKTIQRDGVKKNYSISSGTDVTYKENSSLYDSDGYHDVGYLAFFNNHDSGASFLSAVSDYAGMYINKGLNAFSSWANKKFNKNATEDKKNETDEILKKFLDTYLTKNVQRDGENVPEDSDAKKKLNEQLTNLNLPGAKFKFNWKPDFDMSFDDDKDWKNYANLERGFYLGTTGDSYMDIQVFPITAVSHAKDSTYQAKLDSTQNAYNESLGWVAPWAEEGVNENALYVHDFVFSVKGGATRPYERPDSTYFYKMGTPLGHPTMKIDNPKIQVLNPIRGNVPSDESAFFDLVLTNESEVQSGLNMKPGSFTLKVDDKSNPNGLKVYIDGVPLSNEYTIKMNLGETIRKTIEVVRGTASDYENVALLFKTGTYPATLTDKGYFSIHYVPTSTPLTITSPVDKWVLNTLQPKDNDSTGYYLSVDVEGFDLDPLHYPNFDHIEIQYKETNKGEDAWVNLCSFYNDSVLYTQASGVKEMLSGNNAIKGFRFYGGKDPVEMKYDIRAVSFSRLGTSFVTRSSNVVSGIKDTRCPRVFGNAEPTTGILMYGDVIRLPFTEPIAYNYLDKTANFSILGYINNEDVFTGTSLKFAGDAHQSARSEVTRNLVDRSFTVDMMVRPENGNSPMVFFSHGDQEHGMTFGMENNRKLVATIDGVRFCSSNLEDPIDNSTLTRVGMIYNNRTHSITFFEGNVLYSDTAHKLTEPYRGNGMINLGADIDNSEGSLFSGSMKEVRLWNDTLSSGELDAHNYKTLMGHEHQLIAYYPLSETQGNVAKDVASGADLTLSNTTWDVKMGHSLRIDKKAITADPMQFTQTPNSSYTLMFWFKTEGQPATTDTIAIFSAGRKDLPEVGMNKLAIRYEGKNLVVRSKGVSHSLGYDYADAEWHNIALAVNRAHNAVTVYVDGRLAAQCEASEFEGISSDYVALGSSEFEGNIDDLSLWKVVLPAQYIETHYNAILKGDEQDLAVYLPFCRNADSDQGLAEEPFSPYNEVKTYDQNISLYDSRTLVLTNADTINDDKQRFAPLRNRKELQKLDFDWSSNGTDLMINILTDQKKYNHQNIYLTVRNVEDVNGNTMKNAEMWSVYADLNQLSWLNYYYNVEMKYGEIDPKDRTFEATIFNYSGTKRNYVIQTSEPWLTTLNSRGECEPDDMTFIEFEISDNLNPGEYVNYVTLMDENGLFETMEVHVKVVADEPEWDVMKANNTMNYIGIVKIKTISGAEVIDNDSHDIISAFADSKCVGKANISIDRQTGESYLFMTIYGDSAMITKKSPISFKLWDSSTGEILNMNSDTTVVFIPNKIIGCPPSNPDTLHVAKSTSQQLKLNKGWNWISMNVTPSNLLNNLFAETSLFSDNDEIKREQFSRFNKSLQMWRGPLNSLISRKNVYQIYVANPGTYNILGTEIPDSLRKVSIKGGGTWNDLPYPMTVTLPLINALADFPIGSKAQVGDIIKSIDRFAVAKGQNEWIGTLDAMRPGCGYYLYHRGENCEIKFVNVATTKSATMMSENDSEDHRYSNNMPVMAMFDTEVDVQDDDKLVAYVGEKRVGEAERFNVDGSSIYFLSVQANNGDIVTFAQQREGETLAQTKAGIIYDASAIIGTLNEPYVVSFSKDFVTASPRLFEADVEFVVACEKGSDVSINVYSTDGKVVWNYATEATASETYITMNGAALPAGVYMATVRVNDKEQTIKLVRK